MTKTLAQVGFEAFCKYGSHDWERIAQAVITAHEAAQVKRWPPPIGKDGDEVLAWVPDHSGWFHVFCFSGKWRLHEPLDIKPTHYRPMLPKPEGL